jgi:hypothetical protein
MVPQNASASFPGLSGLANDSWFSNREQSSIRVRIYLAVGIPPRQFLDAVNAFSPPNDPLLSVTVPVRFAWGSVNGMKLPEMKMRLSVKESGGLEFQVQTNEFELPESNHIFLVAPFDCDGTPGDEQAVGTALDSAAALLQLHAGHNFLREMLFDGEVEASSGKFSVTGKAWAVPQNVEGPFLITEEGKALEEICERLQKMPDRIRSRLVTSLRLLERAIRGDWDLLDYFTALEVVADGKSSTIKQKLGLIYSIKNQNEVAERTGFKTLAQWRHDYVHKGEVRSLPADVARYVQLMFLDILRHELGLRALGHLARAQRRSGFELPSLGLEAGSVRLELPA